MTSGRSTTRANSSAVHKTKVRCQLSLVSRIFVNKLHTRVITQWCTENKQHTLAEPPATLYALSYIDFPKRQFALASHSPISASGKECNNYALPSVTLRLGSIASQFIMRGQEDMGMRPMARRTIPSHKTRIAAVDTVEGAPMQVAELTEQSNLENSPS